MNITTLTKKASTAALLGAAFTIGSVAYAAATIPAACSTPGTCSDITSTFQAVASKTKIQFLGSNGTNFVALQAPAGQAADVTLTLPATAGNDGEVLKTDGSGNLDWTEASGLRGKPVANQAALVALTAKDFEKRVLLDNKKEYIFRTTANLTAGEIADTANIADGAGTGKWVFQPSIVIEDISKTLVVLSEDNGVYGAWSDGQVNTYNIDTSNAKYLEITFREATGTKGQFVARIDLSVTPYASLESPYDTWHTRTTVHRKGTTTDISFTDSDMAAQVVMMRAIGYANIKSVIRPTDLPISGGTGVDGQVLTSNGDGTASFKRAGLTHSSAEQKTGDKWIDGKDIYVKSISATSPAQNHGKYIDDVIIDTLIDTKLLIVRGDNVRMLINNLQDFQVYRSDGKIRIWLMDGAADSFKERPVTGLIYYTK